MLWQWKVCLTKNGKCSRSMQTYWISYEFYIWWAVEFQEQFDLHSMSFSVISYKTIQRVKRSGVRVCKIETNSY